MKYEKNDFFIMYHFIYCLSGIGASCVTLPQKPITLGWVSEKPSLCEGTERRL